MQWVQLQWKTVNSLAIIKLLLQTILKNININAKAIDELKGQVGQSSTVINDIKKQITNINGKVENNTTNIANNTTNIAKNTTAINNVNVKVDANTRLSQIIAKQLSNATKQQKVDTNTTNIVNKYNCD